LPANVVEIHTSVFVEKAKHVYKYVHQNECEKAFEILLNT